MKQPYLTRRLEGRLFVEASTMFMVLDADERSGIARVSCRMDGLQQVVEMPIADVVRRISSAGSLILDNMNSPDSLRRVTQQGSDWYFASREGSIGPYATRTEAAQNLCRYILAMQTTPPQARATAPSVSVDTISRAPKNRRALDKGPELKSAAG